MRAVAVRGASAAALCLLAGCGGGSAADVDASLAAPGPAPVHASWSPNRETAVNRPGGGYRIYHAPVADFALDRAAGVIDVRYVSGERAPTSALLALPPGTHYLRIVAYSMLNPAGSDPSPATAVVVP